MADMLNKDLEENPLESPDSLFAFSEEKKVDEPAKESTETPAEGDKPAEGEAKEGEAVEAKPEEAKPAEGEAPEKTETPAEAAGEGGEAPAEAAGDAIGTAVDDLDKIIADMNLGSGDENKETEKQLRAVMEKLSQTQIQLMESNMDRDGYKGKWVDAHGQLSELTTKKPLLETIEGDPQLLMFVRLNADTSDNAKKKKVDFLANKIQELTGVDVFSVIQNNQQSATSMDKTGGMEELPKPTDDSDLPELFGGRSR